jgi:hypothetical protein
LAAADVALDRLRLLLRDTQFFQLRGDIRAVTTHFNLIIDGQNFPILADVERLPCGVFALAGNNTICLGSLTGGIAQNRIIRLQRFREFLVGLRVVATGCEIGDVKLANLLTARTERFAFGRSATGEGFGKPRKNDRLFALEIGKFVSFAVAALQLKIRRRIARL